MADRPLFSSRYGVLAFRGGEVMEPWTRRHLPDKRMVPELVAVTPHVEPERRCNCPGPTIYASPDRCPCRQTITQEDLLCDQCREYCWAITDAGEYVRMRDVVRAAPAVPLLAEELV